MNWYTRLTFISGNSNKEYNVSIKPDATIPTLYNVDIAYGRIGSSLNRFIKNSSPLSLKDAISEATKAINTKKRKGYIVDSEAHDLGDDSATTQAPKPPIAFAHKTKVSPSFEVIEHDLSNVPITPKKVEFGVQLLNPVSSEQAYKFLAENWFTPSLAQRA